MNKTIKFVYFNQFSNIVETETGVFDCSEINFVNDSTIVTYRIDSQSRKFIPDFNGTQLNKNKMLSYFLGNKYADSAPLFINAHYDLLKSKLNENDPVMRKAILNYLTEMKNVLKK